MIYRAGLFFLLSLAPLRAGFISISNPSSTYLAGSSTVPLGALSLASSPTSLTSGALSVGLGPSWQVGVLGAASFGVWTNYAGSVIETPGPSRVLYQSNPGTFSFNFSGAAVRTFGLELAPYDGFDSAFTLTFFSGSTQLGSVTRTVGFDLPNSTPTFYARLFAASSLTAFDRVEVSTTGGYGPVVSQLRWSSTALDQSVGAVPEPSTSALLGAGALVAVFARSRNSRKP